MDANKGRSVSLDDRMFQLYNYQTTMEIDPVIGGYLEFELPHSNKDFIHSSGFLVNSGQSALEYVLKVLGTKVKKIWLPYFTCEIVLNPIKRLGLEYGFYHIDESLELTECPTLHDGEYIIINNYFGIKDSYIQDIYHLYKDRLIVDNAQAWYSDDTICEKSIYSPRKFFGVPDGGIAFVNGDLLSITEQATSFDKCSHLMKRIDFNPESGYDDFRFNSKLLANEPLKRMSSLSYRILSSIDFENVKERRIANFNHLHESLRHTNKLSIPDIGSFECPMVYPYLTDDTDLRKKLIDNKIFVATYWPNVFRWCEPYSTEYKLAQNLLPLPIDQRYGEEEMNRIIMQII